MKLSIERERLLRPLSQATSVVERRQTLPILANVLLSLEKGQLWLVGTDLEVEVVAGIDRVEGEDGQCTVTARKLLDICRALPDGAPIELKVDGEKASIRSGSSRFSLQTLPAADFPRVETESWDERLRLEQGALKQLLERTSFAMAQQDVRYYLNGLLFEVEGSVIRAVGTDGHRLAKSEVEVEAGNGEMRQVIVPRKAVIEVGRFLDAGDESVTVELNPNHVRFRLDSLTFTSKLIDGRFPDYRRVIPDDLTIHLAVDRRILLDTLARVAILTNEKYRGVRLTLDENRLQVSAQSPEQEEANDELEVAYDGGKLEMGFNVSYLIDALNAIDTEQVELGMQDPNSSCTVSVPADDRTIYLVMPMRL